MRRFIVVGTVVLMTTGLTTACATKGQLRELQATQQSALAEERAQREAAEQELRQTLNAMDADLDALRADLQQLRQDFGAQITALEGRLQFAMPIHFEFDQAEVQANYLPALDRFAEVVQEHYRGSFVTIEGFADPAGSAEYNRRLSERRAEAVQDYLLERGLAEDRVRTVGLGSQRQVVPGAAAATPGAELNRRVVFVIEGPVAQPLPGQPVSGEST